MSYRSGADPAGASDLSEMVTLKEGATATLWTTATVTTPIGYQTTVRVVARVSLLEVGDGEVVLAVAQSVSSEDERGSG